MSFSEDINSLISNGDRDEINSTTSDMMYKMTIDFIMLCAFMKYVIVSNMDSTLIIATDSRGSGVSYTHALK